MVCIEIGKLTLEPTLGKIDPLLIFIVFLYDVIIFP